MACPVLQFLIRIATNLDAKIDRGNKASVECLCTIWYGAPKNVTASITFIFRSHHRNLLLLPQTINLNPRLTPLPPLPNCAILTAL
ncbi:hypothetical protein OIU79_029009 [Salix purpurea]|uniref:Uncharacterized protein n=1 Tax=Salix purpurea TaxID=77065 RepID=A0A9Q0VXC8_SALPP|nr:hypothetical protein OIU79_029009 [Salix purpurea]